MKFITNIIAFFVPFILLNGIIYFIGCFITIDSNPLNWLIFKTDLGIFLFIFFQLIILKNIIKFWDILGLKIN